MVAPLTPGERLGKYVIENKIAAGGMAEIYRAHLVTDQQAIFAVKKILSAYSTNPSLISMLVNEAKVSASLRHQNIVPIFDFGRVGENYYLAMEFVQGRNLKTIINACRQQGEAIPIEIALFITMEILEALAYAHKKRDNFNQPLEIVHRDISPHNVMISERGEVKVLDFGIAKVRGKAAETQTGILKGKFSYMSPEQANGYRVDYRTDLFSVGILLYELLTLENPFDSDTELETLNHVRRARYRSPSILNRNISKSLEKLVAKSLRKRAGWRFQSAEDFQAAVYKIQKSGFGFAGSFELRRFVNRLFQESAAEHEFYFDNVDQRPRQYEFERQEVTDGSLLLHRKRRGGFRVLWIIFALSSLFATIGLILTWVHLGSVRELGKRLSMLSNQVQELSKAPAPVATPNGVTSGPAAVAKPRPTYNPDNIPLVFLPDAKRYLDELPFERFETVRNLVQDKLRVHLRRREVQNSIELATPYRLKVNGLVVVFRLKSDGSAVEVQALMSK